MGHKTQVNQSRFLSSWLLYARICLPSLMLFSLLRRMKWYLIRKQAPRGDSSSLRYLTMKTVRVVSN